MKLIIPILLITVFVQSLYSQKWEELNNLALDKYGEGDLESAIEYCHKAFDMAKQDSNKATSANNLGYLYGIISDYEKAVHYYNQAINLREKVFGKESPRCCESMNNLSLLHMNFGKFDDALIIMLENEQATKKVYGNESGDYFKILNQLGTVYYETGNYKNAGIWYEKGLKTGKALVGEKNLFIAQNMNSLGVVYFNMGDYPKGEKYLLKAMEIRKELSGTNSPEYAQSLMNLATLYTEQGKYKDAEQNFISAANIIQEKQGQEHPEYARIMNNLADLYRRIGLYEQSEKYFNICISAQEKTKDGKNTDYARYISNMALLYQELDEREKSEELRVQALNIIETRLGTGHPDYATALNNLATFYSKTGDFFKAEPLLIKARAMYLEKFGEDNPNYIKASCNLATLYTGQGKFKEAGEIYKSLEKKWKEVFGEKHPDYAGMMHDLAMIHENMGETEKAQAYYEEMLKSLYFEIDYNFSYLTEPEKFSYLEKTRKKFDHFNLFVIAHKNQYPQLTAVSYENERMLKGMSLRSSNAMRDNILSSGDTLVIKHYLNWLDVRKQLSELYSTPFSEQRDKDIAAYENYSNAYEKELNRVSQDFRKSSEKVTMADIQQNLGEDEAAIEFINVTVNDKKVNYYALVLKKHDKYPALIELFSLDSLKMLLAYQAKSDYDYVNGIYGTKKDSGNELYDMVWKPLEQALININTIYYAPAGLLHKVSFAAMLCPDQQWLSEKYRLIRLTSTSNITANGNDVIGTSCGVTVYGGVDFDTETTTKSMWKYLPGTKTEAENISNVLTGSGIKSKLVMGSAASEAGLKACEYHSPCILHVATHGFFFPGPEETTAEESSKNLATRGCRGFRFVKSDNPLMRSGIVLAGANNVWNKDEKSLDDDGVLTAYEVSNLNFENTMLVTLSACNTGLGDIRGSEGVYGLQRAFRMAGVKYLVISLWEVPDKETMEFMTIFYSGLAKGMNIPDAFHNAR
ncbi:MAG: CHAT domain-containing tetratricopeptide repeat protein, partial [Bacteroidota bacterium]